MVCVEKSLGKFYSFNLHVQIGVAMWKHKHIDAQGRKALQNGLSKHDKIAQTRILLALIKAHILSAPWSFRTVMMGLHQIPFFNFMFIPSKHTFTKSKLWSESWTLSSKWAKCFFELVIIFKECFWTTRCWKKASWCDIYPTYTTTAVIVAFQTLPFSQIQLLNAMPSWDNFFHQAKKKRS